MREGREVVVESKEDVGREEEDKTRKYVSQETLDNNGSHQLTPHEKSGRSVREPGSDETPLSDFRGGARLEGGSTDCSITYSSY